MPQFRYTARDERGKLVTGTMAAASTEALADQLKRMGYLVTKTQQAADGVSLETLLAGLQRVGYDELTLFNVQLSKMVRVGIPLVGALQTLAEQTSNPVLKHAIGDVARNVEAGSTFSESLARHPRIFPGLFVSMVRSGEVSGKLDEILKRLAEFSKHEGETRQQIFTAMTYPIILLCVGIGVAAFLVVGVIPKFMGIFMEAHIPLPAPTRLLQATSELLRHQWLWLALLAMALAAGGQAYLRTPHGRRQWDTLLLRLPVIGDLARKTVLSRLSRTLETLLSSGVPVLESLAIAEQTCGNTVIADVMRHIETSVKQGGSLSDPMRVSREFPPMVVQMLSVGETTGTLDHMLREIADHYDELVRHGLKRLTTFIEPVFLLAMGAMVAFIMASILLPMFKMVNVIH